MSYERKNSQILEDFEPHLSRPRTELCPVQQEVLGEISRDHPQMQVSGTYMILHIPIILAPFEQRAMNMCTWPYSRKAHLFIRRLLRVENRPCSIAGGCTLDVSRPES